MASTVVLILADSAANWSAIGAIGQCVAAIGALAVAVVALRWDHRQRRDREKAQAALVTIKVGGCYSTGVYGVTSFMSVTITNHSDQFVYLPRIKSMGDVRPPARWGWDQLSMVNEERDEHGLGTAGALLPGEYTRVPYQQDDLDPQIDNFFNDKMQYVEVDDVTITFGMSGAWWQRTGHSEPVRIAQPDPTQPLRAQAGPFASDWISRIRRHVRHRPD